MINIFTLRDFKYQGGGLFRILGVLKTMDFNIQKVRLLNNSISAKSILKEDFPELDVCFFDLFFSKKDKKLFQFAISILPIAIVNLLFRNKLHLLKLLSEKYELEKQVLFCCEYLDLSLGYYMQKNELISGYVCDMHGIVPNEFLTKTSNKIYNYFRYLSATALDMKVFSNSQGIVYASCAMKQYMENRIPKLQLKKNIILPYLVLTKSTDFKVCPLRLSKIKKEHSISEKDDVIFFAGSFKELGGVMDLLRAFKNLALKNDRVKLFLIGQGDEVKNVNSFIQKYKLQKRVTHIKSVPYSELRTYQEISSVIVCPDRYNLYSNMILHLKYIDSLLSNKIVINGDFDAVKEINHNEDLSINFSPSSVTDLFEKISYCLGKKDELERKYERNIDYVKRNLTYESLNNSVTELF